MSSLVPGVSAGLRESLTRVTEGGQPADPGFSRLVAAYLQPVPEPDLVGIEPASLAATVAAHLALGATRRPGEHLVRVITPGQVPGIGADGSTLALLVSDDRPFLVDTVTMELTGRDWSLRRLYHPQLRVARDADGRLVELAAGDHGLAESWIALEVYPPLGEAADGLAGALADGLRRALEVLTVVVDDWRPMVARARSAADELRGTGPDAEEAVAVLDWLAADNFVFLGAADYVRDGDRLVPVPGTGLGLLTGATEPDDVTVPVAGERDPLVLVRDPRRSPVHRPVHLEHVAVRTYADDGTLVREHRFLGLLAASAYTESVATIPLLAAKSRQLLEGSGFEPHSHGWNAVRQVVATYPRDELFEAKVEELAPIVAAVAGLRERRQARVFLRRARYGAFATALVYLPRDRYNTDTRLRIQQILIERLGGVEVEFSTLVSESVLTRLFFVVRLGPDAPAEPDGELIAREVAAAARSWEDDFVALVDALPSEQRGVEFSEAYTADYAPSAAVADLTLANQLVDHDDLRLCIFSPHDPSDPSDVRLKVITQRAMSLTEVMPHLAVLGADVVDERPYSWDLRGRRVLVYDFGLKLPADLAARARTVGIRQRFMDVFVASVTGRCEADALNRLVVAAGLDWRQVSWLRAISRYLQQAGVPFSQPYLATALNAHPDLAAGLAAAFADRFDPDAHATPEARDAAYAERRADLLAQLDAVESLDHDRILRAFLAVVDASVRTNAFTGTDTLALKLLPAQLALLPEPRPAFEVFVYSPRVQGVHLRFGAVARGGLRWSDRREDFRTEVLGLVKAQLVKNTVIVPSGAKGGFVPQHLPDAADRAAWLAEGKACYRVFVDALLGITDNIVAGRVVPPERVVRYDGDDPYLVVAADKGTATFSDLANEVSVGRGFWLGDAFASGGSSGYDHKAMGITARGAWESVRRHFADLGLDPAVDAFTCVGIGDMAGDVFGNGMLLSDRMSLVAAFNHVHVFLDPDPDPAVSFAERQRLFALSGSTWADYDASLVSAGGGVFRRDAKSVPVSPQVRRVLGLPEDAEHLTPNELVSAILCAPVDLLFNGGVGTFVKAAPESHADAGDKANDAVRVDGGRLRARCVAEGGNLGFTQLGRVEYARAGGRIGTDFIDNSAGVDTSDHEVNIKILLAPEVESGRLGEDDRRALLASMTDEVARLVLAHNFDQNVALANSMYRRVVLAGQHEAWMRTLTDDGLLDRSIEDLPSSAEMTERIAAGEGLTRPELAVLLSYTKIALDRWVLASDLPDDPYLADRLVQYFPEPLRERYADRMPAHRLAREIVATVAVNRFVNSQGITAYHRLSTETGSGIADIIRAQLASRAIFAVGLDEVRLRRNTGLAAADATRLRVTLRRMVERATRWLLHHQRGALDVTAAVAAYGAEIAQLRPELPRLLTGGQATAAQELTAHWIEAGLSAELAATMATAGQAHTLLSVVEVAHRLGLAPLRVAEVHYRLSAAAGIDQLAAGVDGLPRQVRWDAMARAALRDELLAAHAELTAEVLSGADPDAPPSQVVAAWAASEAALATRVATIRALTDGPADVARMNVGLAQVRAMLG
ncbi:MAG: NAD-glutamate dehydrogenase [Propionicimonas sp.]|uniref:NAD-glutamate dehydrogenase n=1 Tax=Propionicimonas sp. TaxID=1955623 RepID=UPI003D0B801F